MKQTTKRTKYVFSRITGFSTPFFGLSWNSGDQAKISGILRRADLVSSVVEDYCSVESLVWKAKDKFSRRQYVKDEAVDLIRPATNKAAAVRDKIRARQAELESLLPILNKASLLFLLIFAQLLNLAISEGDEIENDSEGGQKLSENVDEVRAILDALSGSISIYQKVIDHGESALDDDEAELFRFLTLGS